MKKSIHPQWYDQAMVSCACGNKFTVGAIKPEIKVDICSKCHPFFTGEMKYVDTLGRVEKFQKRQKFAATQSKVLADKKMKKQERKEALKNQKSLKEMLASLQ